jgi:hypothetical protein
MCRNFTGGFLRGAVTTSDNDEWLISVKDTKFPSVRPQTVDATKMYRNMGTAPSQTAHALIPLFQYLSSPGRFNLFALAPVARIMASAVSNSSSPGAHSRQYLKGRTDRSKREIVSVMTVVPNRTDCARNFSIISGPKIPSGKPG